jgi:hypothetical protein
VRVKQALRVRLSGADLRRKVLSMLEADPAIGAILIEVNQGGEVWLDILHGLPVKVKHQTVKKEIRAANVLNDYQLGDVIHANGLMDLETEQVGFPRAPHDDLVDAVGTGLAYFLHRPFEFHQADALAYLAEHGHEFDVIHASPPCQDPLRADSATGRPRLDEWPRRPHWSRPERCSTQIGKPYVIENVQGALRFVGTSRLCGEMFGLDVIRHRYFELGGWTMPAPVHIPPPRSGVVVGVTASYYEGPYVAVYGEGGGKGTGRGLASRYGHRLDG